MTNIHAEHASKVVAAFKEKLSESGRQHVGDIHFDELALLIESAISSAVLDEMETVVHKLDQCRKEIRVHMGRFS